VVGIGREGAAENGRFASGLEVALVGNWLYNDEVQASSNLAAHNRARYWFIGKSSTNSTAFLDVYNSISNLIYGHERWPNGCQKVSNPRKWRNRAIAVDFGRSGGEKLVKNADLLMSKTKNLHMS
jgi:hypothetical protein